MRRGAGFLFDRRHGQCKLIFFIDFFVIFSPPTKHLRHALRQDGDNDLLMAEPASNTLSWLEFLGDQFNTQPHVLAVSVPGVNFVWSGDLDGI